MTKKLPLKYRVFGCLMKKAHKLGEYCNEYPSDNFAYGLYLIIIDVASKIIK